MSKTKKEKPNPYAFFDPDIGKEYLISFSIHSPNAPSLLKGVQKKRVTGWNLGTYVKREVEGKTISQPCFELLFEGFSLAFMENISKPAVIFGGFMITVKQQDESEIEVRFIEHGIHNNTPASKESNP